MFNQSNKQYECYQQKTGAVDTTSINPSANYTGAASNIIASGQAFFIRAAGANQSVSFRENAKTTTQPLATVTLDSVFNALPPSAKADLPDVPNPSLRFRLVKDSVNTDEIVVSFSDQGNVNYNAWDAEDIGGLGAQESLSALSADSVKLAIHTVPLPVGMASLSVPLFVSATSSGLYKLNLAGIANLPAKYQVWLMDSYKKDSLDIRSYLNYNFNIDLSDTASYGSNRFSLVIRENPAMVTRLLTFNAVKASGTGILTWDTNNTNDAAAYCVQRSTDNGKTFTTLSIVSAGSSDNYMYVDNDPAKAIDLYRLQYTIDKKQQFSDILPLDFSANPTVALTLYPNPTANLINLKINNNQSNNYTIMLMSSSGSVINKSNAIDTSWQYNAANLLPGAYIISVYDNREHMPVGTGKFIKQ